LIADFAAAFTGLLLATFVAGLAVLTASLDTIFATGFATGFTGAFAAAFAGLTTALAGDFVEVFLMGVAVLIDFPLVTKFFMVFLADVTALLLLPAALETALADSFFGLLAIWPFNI
jgi:hypothetical protein